MKRSSKLLYVAALAAVIGLLAVGCKNPGNLGGKSSVTGVTLNKSTLSLAVGGTEKLTAAVQPATAANKSVKWSSGNTNVATVRNGTVTAIAEGRTMITVTTVDGGFTGRCMVTVGPVGSVGMDQSPVSSDYTVSGLTHTWDGSPKAASIEPKEDRSTGAITVYYEGIDGTTYAKSATPPSAAGTYTVTFDVAAADGWETASGLPAGTLIIIENIPSNQTPVEGDYNISGLEQIHDGSLKTVTITAKAGKSTGAVTVYYDGSTTAPSAVGIYTVTFRVAAVTGWNAVSGLPAGTLVIANNPASTVKYKIYSDGTLSEGYRIDIWANEPAFQLASTAGGGHNGTRAMRLPDTGESWGRGISIRRTGTPAIDWSTVDALSFWVKGDNVRVSSFGFLDDAGSGTDPLNTEHKGENGQGITLNSTWQNILIPLPASRAKNATISRTEVFKIWLVGDQNGKAVYIDDIELIPASRDFSIVIPSTATASSGTVSIVTLLGNYRAEYTVNGKTVTLLNKTVPNDDNGTVTFANWFDITPTVGGSATLSGNNNINATGNFNLKVSFGGKTSNQLNVTVTTSQPSNQTPVAGDYNFGNLSQTAGSVTAVTITPKSGKSPGAISNIRYNNNTTIPQTAGSYPVTFNVAAATGWNAANDLSAGTLTVNAANVAVVPNGWIGGDDALDVDANGYLRNQKGQEVILRGVNLGGWMLQETWMCTVTGSEANLDTLKAMENRGWSAAQIQELFDTYQDNMITLDDFNLLKARGVNSIRIPFWYRNFMSNESGAWINGDDGSSANTRNPGFRRLDWAITQAKKRGMYVILDMHGVPGGQSMDHCSGTLNKNEVYTNPVYEQATVDLWKALARRYKDEATVAAYDLMNEPQNNGGKSGPNAWGPDSTRAVHETVRIYDRLYREIRTVDPNTICMMEGIWSMNMPDPKLVYTGALDTNQRYSGKKTAWSKNVMYSMHLYDNDQGGINNRVNELKNARQNWKVAVHIGEFNNDSNGNQTYAYNLYNDNKINWNMWTYKIAGANVGNWSLYQASGKTNVNPYNDSFDTIKSRWGTTLRTFNAGTNTTASGYSQTGMNSYFNAGLGHTVSGVFTNSNQSGFPAGGKAGPILVDDSDTGSGLVTGSGSGETYAAYGSVNLESGWTRYEAENTAVATVYNSSRTGDTPPGTEAQSFYSGGRAAGGLNKAGNINDISSTLDWSTTTSIAYVKFTVNVSQAGRYLIKIRYNGNDDKYILVKANNSPHKTVSLPAQAGGEWNTVYARQVDLQLNGGNNTIWVSGTIGSTSLWANIDCIDIRSTPLQ